MLQKVLLISCLLCSSLAHSEMQRVREIRYLMGTRAVITVYTSAPEQAKRTVQRAFAEAERLDRLLSNYKEDSELSRFNRSTGVMEISQTFMEFLKIADSAYHETNGIFDISIEPLIHVWRRSFKERQLPVPAEFMKAQEKVGFDKLSFESASSVKLPAGFEINSGGLGKGFAVDRMAAVLRADGIHSALINLGESSILAIGSPPDEIAWRVEFAFPDGDAIGVVSLKDKALSASFSHGSGATIKGVSYGHLIDPISGKAVKKSVKVAVLKGDATSAEIWSTTLAIERAARPVKKTLAPFPHYIKEGEKVYVIGDFPLEPHVG